jgi:hypothetical protein
MKSRSIIFIILLSFSFAFAQLSYLNAARAMSDITYIRHQIQVRQLKLLNWAAVKYESVEVGLSIPF